jgi:hypothetical protein
MGLEIVASVFIIMGLNRNISNDRQHKKIIIKVSTKTYKWST